MKAESTGFADGSESGIKEDQGFGSDQRACMEEMWEEEVMSVCVTVEWEVDQEP